MVCLKKLTWARTGSRPLKNFNQLTLISQPGSKGGAAENTFDGRWSYKESSTRQRLPSFSLVCRSFCLPQPKLTKTLPRRTKKLIFHPFNSFSSALTLNKNIWLKGKLGQAGLELLAAETLLLILCSLSLFWLSKVLIFVRKISDVAPPRVTYLRLHCWEGKERRKQAQHLAGFKPTTSLLRGKCYNYFI